MNKKKSRWILGVGGILKKIDFDPKDTQKVI